MNKRIKKKHELERSLRSAERAIEFLLDQNNQLWNVVERNAQTTNNKLKVIETDVSQMRTQINKNKNSIDVLNSASYDFLDKPKKRWFSRK